MNLLILGLVLIVLHFSTSYAVDDVTYTIDLLPDFIGYLLIWITLEKRRINKSMQNLYVAVSAMSLVSFLFFLGEIKVFFADLLTNELQLIGYLLDGLNQFSLYFGDVLLLIAVVLVGWLLFSMLRYWNRVGEHTLQCTVCKIGMGLCGLSALCHAGATFIILPFSWHWICYPLSLLAIVAAWFVMKDSQEMLTGSHEPVKEYRFGVKK
jgi:hypothetical protein